MCGGGGKGQGGYTPQGGPWGNLTPAQQQTVMASPQAVSWYQQAMSQAQQAASQPFQQYGTQASDFVAQLNPTQQSAISNISGMQGMTAPYYQAATGTLGQALTPTYQTVGQYMTPFMNQVVSPVQQALQQQQGQQLAGQQAEAIRGGAFGNERAGLQRDVLLGQQNLAMGQAISPLYQTGYGQALQAAQQQQQAGLQGANLYGQLGTGAQQAALAQAGAQLGAGTLGQQTDQAGITALYNQFQQQRAYPFQTAQFLSGIAGGLGPLMGQMTYQSQATNPFGQFLAARGGAVKSRMGGAVREAGDYADGGVVGRDGYKLRGSVTSDEDISSILAAQEGMYQDENKPTGTEIPTSGIQTGKGLEGAKFGSLPEGKSITDTIKALTGAAKDVVGMGKDVYGLGKGAYDYLNSGSPGLSKWLSGVGSTTAQTDPLDLAGATSGGGSLDAIGSGLSGLGSAFMSGLETLGPAAAAIFLKDGGRVGYQEGGPAEDDYGFAPAVERTLKFEGGLNPRDTTGLPSMYGISQKAHPGIDVTKLTPEQAKDIYHKEYWGGIGADKLPSDVREMAYDTAVLAGPGKAKQLLALSENDPEKFMAHRRAFLNHLVSADPEKYGKYAKAWENRNQALEGGLGAAKNDLAQSREAIPLTDPRRKFMALDKGQEDTSDEAELGGLSGLAKEEYVVPALAGLGTALAGMVGAKTVSPGAAIASGLGQGLVGGTKSYMDYQKQKTEALKSTLGIIAERYSPTSGGGFYDNVLGKVVTPAERMATMKTMLSQGIGYAPTDVLPSQPSGIVPSETSAPIAEKPEIIEAKKIASEVPKTTEIKPSGALVSPDTVEGILARASESPAVTENYRKADLAQSKADELEANAQNLPLASAAGIMSQANTLRQQASTFRDRGDKIRDQLAAPQISVLTERQKKQVEVETAGPLETAKGIAGAGTKSYEKFNEAAQKFEEEYDTNRSRMAELNHIYSEFQSGRWKENIANLGGIMKSLGLPITEGMEKNVAGFDAALKAAVDTSFKQLQESGATKAPATGLREALLTSPRPEADPAANYKIQRDNLAAMDYKHDLYKDFMESGATDINKFITDWKKDPAHKFDNYIKQAEKEMPPFKGMTKAGAKTTIGGMPQSPGLPEPLKRFGQEFQRSKKNPNLYRNKVTGKIYDASGKEVAQ